MGGTATIADGAQQAGPPEEGALPALALLQRRLSAATQPGEIADAALALMQKTLGAEGATLHLAAADGALRLAGWSGISEQLRAALHSDAPAATWPLDPPAPQRLLVPDLGAESGTRGVAGSRDDLQALRPVLRAEGIAALAVEPLTVRSRLLGMLAVYWTVPRTLDPAELLLLELAGGQLAAAVDRLAEASVSADASQERLATIVEASEDAIIGKDLDGILTSWNPAAQRLYGYTAEEVIGRPVSLLIPADRPDELPAIMERLRRGERIAQYETTRVSKGGVRVDVSISISPITSRRGQIVGAASIARDITGRRQAEREREELLSRERAARERAERAADRTMRLQRVTEALAGAMTMVEIAHAVIEHGLPGVGADAGSMRLLSDDGRWLDMVAAVGFPESLTRQVQQISVTSASPIAVAVRTGVPAWRETGNVDDARFVDFMRRAPAYPSGAALPLVVDGRIVGGIGLSFREARAFSEEDRGFMLALAGQCSQAVHRVRLFENERAAREQLDAILGGVADGVVVQREDGTFIYANDAAARLSGFQSAEEYLGAQTFALSRQLSVLDADGHPFPYDQLPARRAFRGETAPQMVIQFRRPDTGDLRWSRTQARIIRGANGERLAISIFHDMTEERYSRERLRFLAEAGAQLAGSLDVDEALAALVRVAATTLADWAVVILTDDDGVVEHIASAHRDPQKEALAGDLHERQLRHASGARLLWQAIQTGETLLIADVSDDLLVRTARNEEHLALLRALGVSSLLYAPLIGRGRVLGAIALFMSDPGRCFGEEDRAIAIEIARRASLALENARLYRQANDAVQARDEFLSIASHELRTPVTAISGVAQVALRARQRGTLDDARLTRVLEQIIRGSQRLVTLTEDLLDVSRLQSGRIELRLETLDLYTFVADFVERFGANLGEQHQLTLETDRDVQVFQLDSARIEQVLANLLSNAVKYTPEGGRIVVSVRPEERGGRAGARIAVQDQGIGLPPGTEEAIFQPFGRAPNAAHRQIQGLGLGLYICRQILERHGGRIWAESPGDGLGATVQLWLPRTPEPEGEG